MSMYCLKNRQKSHS